MVSTSHKFHPNPTQYKKQYVLHAFKKIGPFEYWAPNNQKTFTLQMNFLRPSVFDLEIDG